VRQQLPTLPYQIDPAAVARSKVMDGVFPLGTNPSLSALDVLKKYQYQPFVEKRHALFKGVLQVAPVFLKNNLHLALPAVGKKQHSDAQDFCRSVLDFVLVSGSEPRTFETHLENAENHITSLQSIVCMVWQVMTSNGQKWLKVDF
jgi:hypothetical protein